MDIPQSKLAIIANQLQALLTTKKILPKDLQSAVGRLLWLTSAWHHLRPLLIPLYRALRHVPMSMVGVSPSVFEKLREKVDDNLR